MNAPMHALAGVITEKFILAAPQEAARALASLATHEVLLLIGPLKAQVVVSCLNPMDPPKAAAVLRRLPLKQASYILARLNVEQAAKLWKEFSTPYRERLSAALEPAFVKLLTEANSFSPDSAGRLMRTDFVAVRTESKLSALIERLKSLPRKKLPAVCYVTGKDGELKGFIRTAELAFYTTQSVCGSVMSPAIFLHPQDSAKQARELFLQAETDSLPVVDDKGILLGVLPKESLPAASEKGSLWARLTK